MVDIFGRDAQGDTDHSKVADTPDNSQGDLLSILAGIQRNKAAAPDQALTPAEEFEEFHAANPAVYKALRHLARRWKRAKGNQPIGFPAIWETARYELGLRTTGDPFSLDNNMRAYYCRLIMLQEFDLTGMFEIRRSPEADAWIAEYARRMGRAA